MKITRIDNGDGAEIEVTLDEARDRLEGNRSFEAGTIDEHIERGEDFMLRTPWAHWRFEIEIPNGGEPTPHTPNPAAVALGRLGGKIGGKSTSPAKVAAARDNGRKGGRPRGEVS